MKIIFCGGGTGGHITPSISVAQGILSKDKNAKILFIGREGGDENRLITKNNFDLKTIKISGLKRKLSMDNFKAVKQLFDAVKQSKNIISEFKPDIVFGTGGYVSFPVIYAAQKMNVKTVIHESNSVMGLSTKLLYKKADRILLSMPESEDFLNKNKNASVVGNPVRDDFIYLKKDRARQKSSLSDDSFVILSFGGSGGSEKMNNVIMDVMKHYSNMNSSVTHIHVTGKKYYQKILDENKDFLSKTKNCHVYEYLDNIPDYLVGADLIISRGGAMSIAEITIAEKISILIPSPNVTNNHQYKNAKTLSDKGAATLIEEKDLTEETLSAAIDELYKNKTRRDTMQNNIKKLKIKNPKEAIIREIFSVLQR